MLTFAVLQSACAGIRRLFAAATRSAVEHHASMIRTSSARSSDQTQLLPSLFKPFDIARVLDVISHSARTAGAHGACA